MALVELRGLQEFCIVLNTVTVSMREVAVENGMDAKAIEGRKYFVPTCDQQLTPAIADTSRPKEAVGSSVYWQFG